MPANQSGFLDKVLGRIDRLDHEGLQTVVQRLANERRFLETLFDAIQDGLIVLDANHRIRHLNRAVERLLGFGGSGVEGQPIERFVPEVDWDSILSGSAAPEKEIAYFEVEIHYPENRFLRVSATSLPRTNPKEQATALILHDATETRRKTFETIEGERIQTLSLLAASLAHEIGNPIQALNLHLQLMEREIRRLRAAGTAEAAPVPGTSRRGAPDPGHRPGGEAFRAIERLSRFLQVSRGEIKRLDYIITEFLHAIRPIQPNREPTYLNEVIEETLDLLGPELENRGIQVVRDLERNATRIPIDRSQIKQVLVNLIKNAMQAMAKDGLLTVRSGSDNGGLWFRVEDTGCGIPSERLNRIFQPYYTTKKKGTGLGLMIVHRIVREHGGQIGVESTLGKGTVFSIRLPLAELRPRLLQAAS